MFHLRCTLPLTCPELGRFRLGLRGASGRHISGPWSANVARLTTRTSAPRAEEGHPAMLFSQATTGLFYCRQSQT